MRKILSVLLLCVLAVTASAVPARRGWQTRTQADGTTIEIQQFGDEFYHYMINREGKQVRETNGMYVEIGEAPTEAVAKARRAKAVARRQKKDVGVTPNLAPKGVVILANFANKSMQSGHTQATFDELCNSTNCTVNSGYPSAAQYFSDQSNGSYRPQFDVFGPVTLSRNVAYYGTDNPGKDEGDDQHATDAVVEACILANEQFSINWADYDSDSDGYVDFVYVIYAGKGQADGGTSETIWPHNWSVESARYSGYCTYTAAQCTVGGKKLDNYAMSGEMSGSSLGGIGTLCHEFGHVMGLPDLYDTDYGTNYENCLTPADWDIMDGGSYNGDGHCPPNYDPWEKDFFGWLTPINLGNEGQNVTLYANGTENQQTYQINASGSYVGPTTSGLRYYIENRQAVGWDAPLTGHGLLIWKVNFNASAWENNAPNNTNTSGSPLYTVVSATGTKIGWDGSTDNCPKNTFPGSGKKTSWTGVSGKPLLNIKESNQIVTLTYIEEPITPVDPFTLTFMANGREFATTQSTGTVVLPATNPLDCPCGKVFLGWTKTAGYESATTAPTYVKAGNPIAEATTLYAVYAEQSGESGEAAFDGTNGGTFKVYAQVGDTKYYATSTVSNSKLQATTSEADAAEFVFEAVADGFTIKAGNSYIKHGSGTNISVSNQSYTWTIGAGSKGTWRINSATNGRALIFRAGQYNVFGGYATSNVTASGTEYYDLEIGGEATAAY
ncbi:MAG: M6 family metalloprotease domain-containing protein, partial [Paludibacteraceae bacterium]|nr:M6 family metalloprotease domain-containing protein [Paludibacteraceae bacterium]